MKHKIETALKVLIGLPLLDSGSAGLRWFAFGNEQVITDHKGNPRMVHDYALHIQCGWQLSDFNKRKIVTGISDDFELPSKTVAGKRFINLGDEKVYTVFQSHVEKPLIVKYIRANSIGGLVLTLSPSYRLEISPNRITELDEYWRLLQPALDTPHFVVKPNGITED